MEIVFYFKKTIREIHLCIWFHEFILASSLWFWLLVLKIDDYQYNIRREFLKDIPTYIWLPWLLVLLQIYDEIKIFVQFG